MAEPARGSVSQERAIPEDLNEVIIGLTKDSNQDILFREWVDLSHEGEKGTKPRVLVISTFCFITLKDTLLKKVRQNLHLLNLQELTCAENDPNEVKLVFADPAFSITVHHPRAIDLVQSILFAYETISFGRPDHERAKQTIPEKFRASYLPPGPSTQDGLLATYLAECYRVDIPARVQLLDYLMTAFQLHDTVLDLADCLSFVKKEEYNKDMSALFGAVRYSDWFTEIVAEDIFIKSFTSLAEALSRKTKITKCTLTNNKVGKAGFVALGQVLGQGKHTLNYLNLSKNNGGDQGMLALAEGLKKGKVVAALSLQSCGVTAKGFVPLADVLQSSDWLQGLTVIELSDNKAGKAGTQALTRWLGTTASWGLKAIYLLRCDLDVDLLLTTITKNSSLKLKVLNISGNKFTKSTPSLLADLLQSTKTLSSIFLCSVGLKSGFANIMAAVMANPNKLKFSVDVSNNVLGGKPMKEFSTQLQVYCKKDPANKTTTGISKLVLNNCTLGQEGLVWLCQSLKGTDIKSLSVDSNVKLGVFAKAAKDAGEYLAGLVMGTPSLEELSIKGDDNHYMKESLDAVFMTLKTCFHLKKLSVQRNRLGDRGLTVLCEALTANKGLKALNCERNRFSMPSVILLAKALAEHQEMVDFTIPMHDIDFIFEKEQRFANQLRGIMHKWELLMEANMARAARRAKEAQLKARALKEKEEVAGVNKNMPPQSGEPEQGDFATYQEFERNNRQRAATRIHQRSCSVMFDAKVSKMRKDEGAVQQPQKPDASAAGGMTSLVEEEEEDSA